MPHRFVSILFAFAPWLTGCGADESGLSGSECDLISCKYDKIVCQRYAAPNDSLVVHYKVVIAEGMEYWAARIAIDVRGINPVEGTILKDQEFLDRVLLSRPAEDVQWPEFGGNSCEISKGGDSVGQETSGKCSFAFDNGYFLTAAFNCTLESALP